MIYLVHFIISKHIDPDDQSELPGLRLIEADSEAEAIAKLVAHYRAKDRAYHVNVTEIHPIIK